MKSYGLLFLILIVGWGGLTLLTTRGLSSSSSTEEDTTRFNALARQLENAHFNYLEAERQRERSESKGEGKARAADPRLPILQEIDKIADRYAGKSEGGHFAVDTFNLSWQFDLDLDNLVRRFGRIVDHYPSHPMLADPVGSVASAYEYSGTPDEWIKLLDKLSRTTRDSDIRIGSVYILGQVQMKSAKLTEAKATFERMLADFPDSPYVTRVKGYLFEIDHLQVGMKAPNFTTKTVDGEEISLESVRGKIVLVNFWATWCPNCVAEAPHLKEMYEKLKSDNRPFEVLNVSLDEDLDQLKSALRRIPLPGVHTWEYDGQEHPVARQYNVFGLPAWFLIDDKGVIRDRNPFGEKLIAAVEAIRGS
jgi:peroxiredoxin